MPVARLAVALRSPALPAARRWPGLRRAWQGSLRFRLLAMGLMPLLVAFPLVIAVLVLVGGERANSLVESNLRSSLAGASSYLQQVRADAGLRVAQMAKSERLIQRLQQGGDARELNLALRAAAEGSGLDFLVVATTDGRIVGSSTGVATGRRLPDSYVIRQAHIGVANVGYERFDAEQMQAFSPALAAQARVDVAAEAGLAPASERRGLLINAAAHFPLSVDMPDAVLVGGILVNRNFALIDHLREIIFPVGSLPGDVEGLSAIHLDAISVVTSSQRLQGHAGAGRVAPAEVVTAVLGRGVPWVGHLPMAGQTQVMGFAPLSDGDGRRIGMLAVGFPDAPYQRAVWLLLGMIAALLALTMLVISIAFLRTGQELTQRLARIGSTMTTVRQGDRTARVGRPQRDDELGQLSQHFDALLGTIAAQDAAQRAAQQTLADEASRRRALFDHARDGVIILNADGSVFEANPRGAAMLGYAADELLRTRVTDWDVGHDADQLRAILRDVGSEGRMLETEVRRKDGSTYTAEVSLSRAEWGDKTFVFVLMRDITERKAVEAELARYRLALEQRVAQRTQELKDRSEQLDAIFALSPDGFVSFDRQGRVSFVNQAFLRMTGLVAADVIGLDEAGFSACLARRSLGARPFPGLAALQAAQATDAAGDQAEGWRRHFELTAPRRRVLEAGLRLSEADTVSQVLYVRDVTHETEVDRMKSEFLTTAAHELRTPMTSIYGFANLLRMRETSPERRNDILGTISQQSELMITILNQLLDLARIEARRDQDFERVRLPLREVVAATVAGFGVPAGRAAPRVDDIDAALCVDADRTKLHQALLNVLSNAYKYSPGGGEVAIASRRADRQGVPCIGIDVRDQGIGMTEEQLSHVCERFYRADASGSIPGTGLGMAIVSEIVALHGGDLQVQSRPGEGTTVTLWLPLADAAPSVHSGAGAALAPA